VTPPARIRLLSAVAALGLALAGCGDDDVGDPIPGGKAAELENQLDRVRDNFDQQRCDLAAAAVDDARATVDTLDDDGVGSDVQDALGDGVDNLASVVSSDCEKEEEVETTPETTPEPTITETTPEPTTTETTPEPTTTEPTTPVPEPEPEPDEDDGSGQFDPGGVKAPPGQAKKLEGDD
jgi:outer membrane murein-binding lipoprotein Lpp